MTQKPRFGIRQKSGWMEAPTKPEGVEATEINDSRGRCWRWCDHLSRMHYFALDGESRCLLCGQKTVGPDGEPTGEENL